MSSGNFTNPAPAAVPNPPNQSNTNTTNTTPPQVSHVDTLPSAKTNDVDSLFANLVNDKSINVSPEMLDQLKRRRSDMSILTTKTPSNVALLIATGKINP